MAFPEKLKLFSRGRNEEPPTESDTSVSLDEVVEQEPIDPDVLSLIEAGLIPEGVEDPLHVFLEPQSRGNIGAESHAASTDLGVLSQVFSDVPWVPHPGAPGIFVNPGQNPPMDPEVEKELEKKASLELDAQDEDVPGLPMPLGQQIPISGDD